LTLLGLSGYFPVRSISWDSQPGEDEIPLDASTAYLFEQFRDQPFAAAAYLRAILYCWAGGVVLLLQHATSAVLGDNSFAERVAWQWLLGQLVVQLMQVCPISRRSCCAIIRLSARGKVEASGVVQAIQLFDHLC
jgi:hypothetical protein